MNWNYLLGRGIVLIGLTMTAACTINGQARVPEPNILAAKKTGGTFKVDVSSVPETELCSQQGGLKDFCVSHFRTAINGGLEKVLSAYIDRTKPGPTYGTTFKLVQFSHSVTSGGSLNAGGPTVKVTLRWQFELLDQAGKPLVQLAETTDGPEQFNDVGAADKAIEALLGAVMEKIAASIKSAEWSKEAAPPASTPEATPVAEPT